MKLKEEWADSYQENGITREIFVNPTSKEVADLKAKGLRWMADSKTKKFYIADNTVWHGQMIEKLKLMDNVPNLPHFKSTRWLTGDLYKGKHNSDLMDSGMIGREKKKTILKKDWSWAYKYLPGLKEYVENLKIVYNLKEDIMKIDNLLNTMLTETKC